MPSQLASLDLETLSGSRQSIEAHAGKVVIVHFFATWCAPCEEELRDLNRIAQTYAASDLAILSVDTGEPRSRIERFFNSAPVAFPVLLDPNKIAMKAWGVDVLPTTFIFTRGLCPALKSDGVVTWTAESVLAALKAAIAQSQSPSCNLPGATQP